MMPTRWHSCACCDGAAEYALAGNRLLSHKDVKRLPAEYLPAISWRCEGHWRYQLRTASAVRATTAGDLLYTLTCGHEVCWVRRGQEAYTQARLARAMITRQIRLDQLQRCYACGDPIAEKGSTSNEPYGPEETSTGRCG
ncbi:MAG TPA: hypothetical protein VF099_09965 [Ktedonobacterales bacterium]